MKEHVFQSNIISLILLYDYYSINTFNKDHFHLQRKLLNLGPLSESTKQGAGGCLPTRRPSLPSLAVVALCGKGEPVVVFSWLVVPEQLFVVQLLPQKKEK